MPFEIQKSNILAFSGDAIINPTDDYLSGSGGLDAQIHKAAGLRFRLECARKKALSVGEAAVTQAGHLKCRYVIHTSAPFWTGSWFQEAQLRSCYKNALALADQLDLKELAFPLIGSGTKGFPKALVLRIAAEEISAYLATHEDTYILLVVHDKSQFRPDPALLNGLEGYIRDVERQEHIELQYEPMLEQASTGPFPPIRVEDYAKERRRSATGPLSSQRPVYPQAKAPSPFSLPKLRKPPGRRKKAEAPPEKDEDYASLPDASFSDASFSDASFSDASFSDASFSDASFPEASFPEASFPEASFPIAAEESFFPDTEPDFFDTHALERSLILDESFSQMVLRKIGERGFKKDSESYTRANIDRRLFSRIRCDEHYHPKKTTALALAVALELSLEETNELLMKAGYSLSHSILSDVIVEYCISHRHYNIFEINELLFQHDQALLGG